MLRRQSVKNPDALEFDEIKVVRGCVFESIALQFQDFYSATHKKIPSLFLFVFQFRLVRQTLSRYIFEAFHETHKLRFLNYFRAENSPNVFESNKVFARAQKKAGFHLRFRNKKRFGWTYYVKEIERRSASKRKM